MSAEDDVLGGYNAFQSMQQAKQDKIKNQKLKDQANINSLKATEESPSVINPMQRRLSLMNNNEEIA